MAKIKLYHQGQLLSELGLNPGEEYFAGRSSSCHLVMNHDRGISRQHIRIAMEDGIWMVTLLSKFGGLIYAGQQVEQIRLDSDTRFTIPPYEFEFSLAEPVVEASPVSDEPLPVESHNGVAADDFLLGEQPLPAIEHSDQNSSNEPMAVEPAPNEIEVQQDNTSGGNLEATRVGASTIVPFLKIMNRSNGHEEVLKLEGNAWIAGRHPDSEIHINDSSISRKHFEIIRGTGGFFIVDHNSSNGTHLNGESLVPGEQYQLISGDVITIRNIQITFEVHDLAFGEKIKNLPAVVPTDDIGDADDDPYAVQHALQVTGDLNEAGSPAVIRVEPGATNSKEAKWKQQKTKIYATVLALVVVLGYFFGDEDTPAPTANVEAHEGGSELGSTKEITPQRMKELQEKYELAQKNFQTGKYNLCRDMLIEIHTEIPNIGDSKNLQKFCEQAIDLEMINRERELKEQKKAEAEAKIRAIVANCQSIYNDTITQEKMQECLAEALELDPQNAGATELLERIRIRDEEKQNQAAQQRAIAALNAEGRAHYKRAADLESRGELRRALNEYQAFLKRQYPGVSIQEESARRSIANIQQNLNQKIAERLSSCRVFIEKTEYKSAINACNEALKEDPRNNDAKELIARAKSEMSRSLKSIYEDSVLEESLGNIEAAKEKWKTILNNSFSGENFYEKAKSKLKKYGG